MVVGVFTVLTLFWATVALASHFKLSERSRAGLRFDVAKIADANAEDVHSVVFVVQPQNLDKLDEVLQEVSTPTNAKYGQYWTRSQIEDLTGNPQAHDGILSYLRSFPEIEIEKETDHGNYIFAKAPVSTWENMFHCKFSEYAIMNYPSTVLRSDALYVPTELDSYIFTVLNTVQLPAPQKRKNSMVVDQLTIDDIKNAGNEALTEELVVSGFVTPGLIAKYYNISDTIGSFNVSQAVYESLGQEMSPGDLSLFQMVMGLMDVPVARNFGGHVTDNCTDEACGEANLDIQYIMGVAQNVNTTFYYTDDWMFGWITSVADLASPSDVYSISYGGPEAGLSPSFTSTFNMEALKLGVMGVTIVASSGDEGAPGSFASYNLSYCGYMAQFPASSPYVTAVGASNGPQSGQPEVTCQASVSDFVLITSGGGFSNYFPQPQWQKDSVANYFAQVTGTPNQPVQTDLDLSYGAYGYFDEFEVLGSFNATNRAYPDVSMLGHSYVVAVGGNFSVFDGTSASAPVFAALVSLVNNQLVMAGKPKLGFVNPFLYTYQSSFAHDITVGDNKCLELSYNPQTQSIYVPCCAEGFVAMPGWDPATGIGSVDYAKFLAVAMNVASAPTASPSIAPSAAPTAAPTSVSQSSAAPTMTMTVSPSVAPTVAPSLEPGMTYPPTYIATASPSVSPSFPPTATPTVTATNNPTAQPSVTQTAAPTTSRPSVAPTRVPTTRPSAMPTPSGVVSVSYPVTQNFQGISAATFNANFATNSLVIASTTASLLGLSASNVVITGVKDAGSAAASSAVSIAKWHRLYKQHHRALQTSAINVNYTVTIPNIYALGYTSPNQAYSASTATLTTAITGTAYTTAMQSEATSLGATSMADVSSHSADFGSYSSSTTNDNGSSKKKTLSGGAIAGIVIGVLAGVALIGFGIFYYITVSAAGGSNANNDNVVGKPVPSPSNSKAGDSPFAGTDNPMRTSRKFNQSVDEL